MASNKGGNVQVRFVGHDATGLPVKRKQVHQACTPCRKRKKRCQHVLADERVARSDPAQVEDATPDSDASDAAAQLLRFFHHVSDNKTNSIDSRETRQPSRQSETSPPFLGDLNPESILLEATMAVAGKPQSSDTDGPKNDAEGILGVLASVSPCRGGDPPSPGKEPADTEPSTVSEVLGSSGTILHRDGTRSRVQIQDATGFATLAQTLVNQVLARKVLPTDMEWGALRDLYLTKIHPIFPIFDRSTLLNPPEETELRELITASVCLAAASDPEARSLLTFDRDAARWAPTDLATGNTRTARSRRASDERQNSRSEKASRSRRIVPFKEYSQEITRFINKRLIELREKQQLPLIHEIHIVAITCLYWQPADPKERFEPLCLFARLVSLAHTHGIHLDLLNRAHTDSRPAADGGGSRLFRCLYALDRLLAAFAGRPVMFHNDDLIRIPSTDEKDPPAFRLFMSLIFLLDQVIEMYRPNPKVSYIDVPVFERLAIEARAQGEPDSILATLEVLYHAICVLSVRMPRQRFRTAPECDTLPCPSYQHLPPSGVNARRSHSADRILDVVKDYKLSPMPFVPYALTLSLSVAYRKWRFSRLPMFRTRGGADFKKVLPVLQEMGRVWNSARLNAQLGQAVMLKLDRNEILHGRRSKCGTEGSRTRDGEQGQSGSRELPVELPIGPNDTSPPTRLSGRVEGGNQPTDGNNSRLSLEPTAGKDSQISDKNGGAEPPPGLDMSMSSTTTSSLEVQPPLRPTAWNVSWNPPLAGEENAPDAIPLPGDFFYPPNVMEGPSVDGVPEYDLNAFLNDDDALFRSWDPKFAQSVDYSFSSNLDPGNPFAWPEYCNYTP
ncbi:Transcription factor domain-containing protein [Madurella fahalii]|uniref:Transcription factor domain-containing protein n=1 Tax=Madurella fahalii TaxID=1157608 RepID=A0ABQ0GJ46_9PEZI